jgi:hypothetical protein
MSKLTRACALVSVAIAVSLALAGTASAGAKPRPAKAWAGAVCSSVDAWSADTQQRLAVAARAVPDEVAPDDARRALVATLSGLADRTDELVVVLKIQGAPAGKGGAATSKALLATYNEVATNLRQMSATVAKAPTDDVVAFTAAVEAATTDATTTLGDAGVDTTLARGRSAVAKAVAADAACRAAAQR